jgi:glycosyltransferase involved in cell wall biosynthesis
LGEPIRVLQVFATLDRGGAEAMIMNFYRSIDRSRVQFDFVVKESNREYAHEAEIKSLGGRIYRLPDYKIINHVSYKRAWKQLLMEHPEWRILHGHHITPAAVYMKVAKQQNRITIAHSHSTKGIRSIKNIVKYFLRLPMKRKVDYPVACSRSAADWMFGRNNKRVKLIRNAIDIKKFQYNENVRLRLREQFSVCDKFVIGHIGNFTKAKNYPFLLEVFQRVKERKENAVLILVGKKENNPRIEELVHQMGLCDSVIFTGARPDIDQLLQMMDLFLFPSLYEGLPVTLIEAQASGLRCIVSDKITDEVKITDRVEFLSLQASPEYWGERILEIKELEERVIGPGMEEAGYDVERETTELERFYQCILTNQVS